MKKSDRELQHMAVEYVEFDEHNQPVSQTMTPLGLYLHETGHSEEEFEMAARLSVMAAKR